MKRIIMLILALTCLLLLCACGSSTGEHLSTDSGAIEQTTEVPPITDPTGSDNPSGSESADNEKTVIIETPFADLRVPESFDKAVSHEVTGEDPCVVTFSSKADDTELFSILFNGNSDSLLGTLIGEEKNTVIYVNVPTLDEKSEHYKDNQFYQEKMNTIIGYLSEDYQIVFNEIIDKEDSSVFDIETSVVTLKYPGKWKDKVQIEVLDDCVKFSSDGTPLFDLIFKECDGNLLGTYNDTPIYMVEYPVESEEHIAMQFGVNTILEHLMEDPNFKN